MKKVYLCDGIRTPIGKYAGGLSSIRADDLGAFSIKYLLFKYKNQIDDVVMGCANQAGEDNRMLPG